MTWNLIWISYVLSKRFFVMYLTSTPFRRQSLNVFFVTFRHFVIIWDQATEWSPKLRWKTLSKNLQTTTRVSNCSHWLNFKTFFSVFFSFLLLSYKRISWIKGLSLKFKLFFYHIFKKFVRNWCLQKSKNDWILKPSFLPILSHS